MRTGVMPIKVARQKRIPGDLSYGGASGGFQHSQRN